jgi:hypothetical protein
MPDTFRGIVQFVYVWSDPEFLIMTLTFIITITWQFHYSELLGMNTYDRKEQVGLIHSALMCIGAAIVIFLKKHTWCYQYFISLTCGYCIVDTEYHLFRSKRANIHRIGLVLHHLTLLANSWLWKNPWDGVYNTQWLSAACYITEISTIILNMRSVAKIKRDEKSYRFWSTILRPTYLLMRPVWLAFVWWFGVRKFETWNDNMLFWAFAQLMYFFLYTISFVYLLMMYNNPRFCDMRLAEESEFTLTSHDTTTTVAGSHGSTASVSAE